MPIIPIPVVRTVRRVTVTRAGRSRRAYACAHCGYRGEAEIAVRVSSHAEGEVATPKKDLESWAKEWVDTRYADLPGRDPTHIGGPSPCSEL